VRKVKYLIKNLCLGHILNLIIFFVISVINLLFLMSFLVDGFLNAVNKSLGESGFAVEDIRKI